MEMLRSSSEPQFLSSEESSAASPHYLIDNFYANGWTNPKNQMFFEEENQNDGAQTAASMADEFPIFTNFLYRAPKLEDFLDDSSSIIRFSDSQTETQSSSLTQIYEHQDLKKITGFQAFSTNSGSEVDGSSPMGGIHLTRVELPGHSTESCGDNSKNNDKAIVKFDSDSSKKVSDTFGQRTSIYRGVTRHRWTGRYEAHLWDNSCRREGQARKGRQGGYDKEEKAARAYDLAALKYWGSTATINFPISNYSKELEEMKHVTKQEFIASIRRKSSGFSRGASIYRGVTRHHQQGRWQARIGRVAGNKDLYLGTFATEEEAAEAYDIAAIKFRGVNAVTNFEMSRYDVEAIAKSSLPIGGAAKRPKHSPELEQKPIVNREQQQSRCSSNGHGVSFTPIQQVSDVPCGITYDSAAATATFYQQNLYHQLETTRVGISEPLSLSSTMATPTTVTSHPAAEFFLWPHRSY
ncbi:AP2-like ethylene-responsive transcription factor AIL6 [Hibiscus syriacus]|uniref:AP2-like ethylene-responsive transcription factor AIL6 n=1 Tax=Hibiscus syriacus TaxID=106335 RepID=A0A6A2YMU9_HIBSY|nr:AP2-like ethylene-responsive transcription factor AIL6 [Hibiscus syriacus]